MRPAGKRRHRSHGKATGTSPGVVGLESSRSRVGSLSLAHPILPGQKLLELFHLDRIENLSNLLLSCLTDGSIAPVGLLVELIESLTTLPQNPGELVLLGLIQTQSIGESAHGPARLISGLLRALGKTSPRTRETRLHQKKS